MNDRHAFLIMAHNNKEQLLELLRQLDHPRNDIYLHIDRKVHLISKKEIEEVVRFSRVEILRSIKVSWGAYSQIQCELDLLKTSLSGNYTYYHLLSGVDCITKPMEQFHTFFEDNYGKEFIHFQGKCVDLNTENHVKYYHFLQQFSHVSRFECINTIIRGIERVLIVLQKCMGINRWKDEMILQKGANWFSITRDLAEYVVAQENWIHKRFSYTLSGDELFLQTLVYNSDFKNCLYQPSFDNDYHQCSRYIDWHRGKPYVFTTKDVKEVMFSDMMFARKCTKELLSNLTKINSTHDI